MICNRKDIKSNGFLITLGLYFLPPSAAKENFNWTSFLLILRSKINKNDVQLK